MAHRPFNVGDVVTNNEMREAYKIGNMGRDLPVLPKEYQI